ncbi:MAG: hypothetical protein MUF81_10145 [Verrucomicrobia bacterium]|jgi:hypothetical protein|nr:hypothetical protein [Verrucomicrobiota bacterium]
MQTNLTMRIIFLLAVSASLLLGGCGKQPAPTATSNSDQPLAGQVDPFLTQQLRIFIQQKGRLPTNFMEFASGMDSRPRKPPGMKWAIDSVSREVKLVKE